MGMRRFRRFLGVVLAAASAASWARAAAPVRLILPGESVSAPTLCGACGLGAAPLSAAPLPAGTFSFPSGLLLPAAAAPAPAAAVALPAPAAAPLYAGAVPAADGASIFPRLADAHDPRDLPAQAEGIRKTALEALQSLRDSVARGGWNGERTTLDQPCCGDAAPKLAVMLRGRGVPARLVEAEFHYYVLVDLPEGQVVVDPTVRQFFGRADAPKSVPTVFVGTVEQLHGLFKSHALAKTTKYDPSRIYFSEARDREDQLRTLDHAVRSGAAAEHEPIRRFLSVPVPPAAAAPRLILH